MKYCAVAVICLLIGACATDPTVIHKPVEVMVPVPVPCVTEVPECPPLRLDQNDYRGKPMYEQVNAILVDLEQVRSCNRELRSLLLKCKETVK